MWSFWVIWPWSLQRLFRCTRIVRSLLSWQAFGSPSDSCCCTSTRSHKRANPQFSVWKADRSNVQCHACNALDLVCWPAWIVAFLAFGFALLRLFFIPFLISSLVIILSALGLLVLAVAWTMVFVRGEWLRQWWGSGEHKTRARGQAKAGFVVTRYWGVGKHEWEEILCMLLSRLQERVLENQTGG